MKNLLIITYYWPPAGGAGVQRWLKFSKYLPEFGWRPIILTVDPQYASYPQIDESLSKEIQEEVQVFRTRSFEPLQWYAKAAGKERVPYGGFSNEKSNSAFSRFVRGNFFIPDARKGWKKHAVAKAKELIDQMDIACTITTGPPQSTHLIGLQLKKDLGIKWGVDLRDPWTDIYYNEKMLRTNLARSFDEKLEREVLTKADFCITVSHGFIELFKGKVNREYELITNGFDKDDIIEGDLRNQSSDMLTVSYTGTMSDIYHPDVFFEALSQIKRPFQLRIVGNVSEGVKKQIAEFGLDAYVKYLGYLKHSEALVEMQKADILFLISPFVKNSKGIIPGKLFEYLAFEKSILALGGDSLSDIALILRSTKSGVFFNRNEKDLLVQFLEDFDTTQPLVSDAQHIAQYGRRRLTSKLSQVIST
ncbi:MAG: glycosyl transferase family 1 [Bacteroidota bacterium]